MLEALKEWIIHLITPPFRELFIVSLACFALGIIGRIMCGVRPGKNKTRTAAICFVVIFMYVISIVIVGQDAHLQFFATALPFFDVAADSISAYHTMMNNFSGFLVELAQLFLTSFAISAMQMAYEYFFTGRKKLFSAIKGGLRSFMIWYILECVIVIVALALNLGFDRALGNMVGETIAKVVIVTLFLVAGISVIMAVLKLFFGTIGIFAKPIFDLIYGFVFDNFIGKMVRKSFLTTLAITIALLFLDYRGALMPIMSYVVGGTVFAPIAILLIAIFYVTCVFL